MGSLEQDPSIQHLTEDEATNLGWSRRAVRGTFLEEVLAVKNAVIGRRSNRSSVVCKWEEIEPALLKAASHRVRSHPAHKRKMMQSSLEAFGIISPIAINASNVIIDGHLRVELALKLGLPSVPIIRVEHMTDAELRAYAIAANKLPSVSSWDDNALRLELEAIVADAPMLDLTLTGFTIGEVDRIKGHHQAGLYDDLDDDIARSSSPTPRARVGDLYALGDHRVICGDALNGAVISRLMGGALAKAAFTDPPYNVKINGHVSSSAAHAEFAMASGEMSSGAFADFLKLALGNLSKHLVDGAIAFVCMDHGHIETLIEAGAAVFDQRLNICVWDKGHGGMGALYRSQHELVAVFKNGTQPHLNNIALGKNGRNRTNVWSFPGMAGFGKGRKKALELHPTVKPVALVAEALLDVSGPGDLVLDPFGGSGSTLIAAERLGRSARLVELDPVYVDRIIARWEKLTGRNAELLAPPLDDPEGSTDAASCTSNPDQTSNHRSA